MKITRPFSISRPLEYAVCALFICALSALCLTFSRYVQPEVVAFILLLGVSVLAMVFDLFPVLLAATLSAVIWDYFFLAPRFDLTLVNTEDRIMLSMYFVIALINGVLTNRIRKAEEAVRHREERIETIRLYDTLLNSLSHEFRTPLAAIIAASDNLSAPDEAFDAATRRRLVEEISIAALRLNEQVENLLNMSRLESGYLSLRKDWCNVRELADGAIARLPESSVSHKIRKEIPDPFPLFYLDYMTMQQVLYNLLHNALQYTPPGSTITLTASAGPDGLTLRLTDDGPGFPENELLRVFEKFYRLPHASSGGTGLGLSIVKGFVEAHGGRVSLANRAGGGSEFTIRIQTEQTKTPIDESPASENPGDR